MYRIVTFMAYPMIFKSPKVSLVGGSRVITLGEKERVFVVRQVFYDEATPMYAIPRRDEDRYSSLQELKEKDNFYPLTEDSPILDKDNYLREWTPAEEDKPKDE